MKNKVGFVYDTMQKVTKNLQVNQGKDTIMPRKSVVQVYFPDDGRTFSYYNDQFDLHKGNLVFVDGALEGIRGCVVEVNYNFRIKLSQYKRVIALADTDVHGELFIAGSHYVSFDPQVLPVSKAASWYFPPEKEEDEYASGNDESSFYLDDLKGMHASDAILDRGRDYYRSNKVSYLSLDGVQGYAIVEGTHPYEVEFSYHDGEISNLTCTCYCSYTCKHEVAVMLQLKETLEMIQKNYGKQFESSNYFAAVRISDLLGYVLGSREAGSIKI